MNGPALVEPGITPLMAFGLVWVLGLVAGCDEAKDPTPDPYAAQIKPDCSRAGELVIELGQGDEHFEALEPGESPELYYGIQGGTHLILAARISTPDPIDAYTVDVHAEVGAEPCIESECPGFVTAGRFVNLVEGPTRIEVTDANTAELVWLFLVVDGWAQNPHRRISLSLEDSCGRTGKTTRDFEL